MAATISTGFILFDIAIILGAALLAVFVYFLHSYQYWKNKGVPYLKPTFPYGNNTYLLPKSASFGGEAKTWYDQFKTRGDKFGGVWSTSRKVLVLVDPDYIKHVLTQDFEYFINRDSFVNEKVDPIGTNLFNIPNPHWKPLRQKLTPTFTSGKMKLMFESVLTCSDFMINYLEKCSKVGDDFNAREVLACFTTDVIGTVAFGIDCNSFDNTHAEFRRAGKELFQLDLKTYMRILMTKSFPELSKTIGLKIFKKETKTFFSNMLKQNIEYRTKNNIDRPDFLQLLINMNKEGNEGDKPFSFESIVANTLLFFIAGFDTSSTTMTFALYELARNPEVQEKARQEINEVLKRHNWNVTYEAIQEMNYLKQVLDEAMRLYPPLTTLGRKCTKDYQLRDTNITIEKGTPIVISTLALGRDPEYFPDPERFDPERFNSEEKSKRHPYVHIPFGEGPRNCIGLRFGLMQSKIGLVRILTNFKLRISPKTKMPVTLDQTVLLLKENEPIYLTADKI